MDDADNSYYEKIGDKVRCIDSEILFDIPEHWSIVRLKDIWELVSGRDLASNEYNSEHKGIPYITGASNFVNGHVELIRWTESPQVITHIGDLLITCKGTIGEIAYNTFGDAHIARQVMAIRNIYNLNTEYLALCLYFHTNSIRKAAKGLIPGISREDLLYLLLPLPPKAYQEKVVHIIYHYNSILSIIEKSLN